MCKILIALCAFIALSSCAEPRGPSSHYLTPKQFQSSDVNFTECYKSTDGDDIYRYSIANLNSTLPNITFSEFKGKAILILNVATYCRSPIEYPQLNKLKEEFGDKLVIVGFPSAQFLNQEPGSPEEILNAIHFVRPGNGFVPKFLLTQKVEVNGANTNPVFSYLKRSCLSTRTRFEEQKYYFWDPKNDRDLKWNFEKYLIDPQSGKPVRRYDTSYAAGNIASDIKSVLNNTPLY